MHMYSLALRASLTSSTLQPQSHDQSKFQSRRELLTRSFNITTTGWILAKRKMHSISCSFLLLEIYSRQSFCKCLREVMITVRPQLWCHGYSDREKGKWHRCLSVLRWWSKKYLVYMKPPDRVGFKWNCRNGYHCGSNRACLCISSLKSQVDIHPFSSVGFFFLSFFALKHLNPSEQKVTKTHLLNIFLNSVVILWAECLPTPSGSTKLN